MPHWQEELDALLAQLRVSLDDPFPPDEVAVDLGGDVRDDAASAMARDLALPVEGEEPPGENEEVGAIRSEIEATLGRVLALARTGRMDDDMRDDVIFVLQALTRPHPSATVSADGASATDGAECAEARDEWQLASAAAVLRFCRMVVRLTNALAADPEG